MRRQKATICTKQEGILAISVVCVEKVGGSVIDKKQTAYLSPDLRKRFPEQYDTEDKRNAKKESYANNIFM